MNPPDSLFSSAPGWSASSTATRRLCEAPERCRRWSGGRDRPTARGQWMGDTPRDTPAGWFIYHENPEMDDWSGVSYNKSQHWPMSHLSLLCLIFLGFSWLGIEWGDTNATIWSIPRLEGVSENWYCIYLANLTVFFFVMDQWILGHTILRWDMNGLCANDLSYL